MAKYFKILAVLMMLITVSCQEGNEAGDLLSQWRMTGSDTKYVSFSGRIVLFRNLGMGEVFGNFQHTGDSLFIQCYSVEGLPSDTINIEEGYGFRPFNDIRLKIESLDGDNLLISKDGKKWGFYKY